MVIDDDKSSASGGSSTTSGSKLVLNSNTILIPEDDNPSNIFITNSGKDTSIGLESNRKRVVFGTRSTSSSIPNNTSTDMTIKQKINSASSNTRKLSKSKKIKNFKKNSIVNSNISNNINNNNLNYLNFKFIENLKTKLWLKLKEMGDDGNQ
ncbi:unnamed protein product [[Candida] boidinii]|nr:unnamed protein product [[Candida] boidinii]